MIDRKKHKRNIKKRLEKRKFDKFLQWIEKIGYTKEDFEKRKGHFLEQYYFYKLGRNFKL